MTLHDAYHFLAQMRQIGVDQPRIPDHAMTEVGWFQAAIGAHEQLRSQGQFDFLQSLAGAGLRQRDLLRRAQQRPVVGEGNQQAQLLEVQAGGDGTERRQHLV